eukprot:Lithocolla_globosa_v1_NODE_5774_length_1186_cov_59.778957.p1 type:complete len:294 gc:universal NODE_5774_length_1186_cov_59.778957:121-1002(+)
MSLSGKVAIITGSTRGIGRECALKLASHGCNIVVCGKSVEETPQLPGSIYTVAKEVEARGAKALPVQVDIRDEKSMENCVKETMRVFGRIDILVNNASALWWHEIKDTPLKKYDLITGINTRGTFYMTKLCMEHMKKNKFGRIVNMSPPIQTHAEAYKGFTAYNISKFGMTMSAMGAAAEGANFNITGNSLWPATVIESQAAINFSLGETSQWRKATILADAVYFLVTGNDTGKQLIDDEYLISKGVTDMKKYRYNPDVEPARILAGERMTDGTDPEFTRGDVRKVKKQQSKL